MLVHVEQDHVSECDELRTERAGRELEIRQEFVC